VRGFPAPHDNPPRADGKPACGSGGFAANDLPPLTF
jgi:hypothetical protein